MKIISDLRRGAVVWVDHHGKHPGVVVDVTDEQATVVVGTRTHRPQIRHVCVRERTREALRMQLSATTYFYQTGSIAIVTDPSLIDPNGRTCPPDVLFKIEELLVSLLNQKGTDSVRATQATPAAAPVASVTPAPAEPPEPPQTE